MTEQFNTRLNAMIRAITGALSEAWNALEPLSNGPPGPPCATAEALAAFIRSVPLTPHNAIRIDECLIVRGEFGQLVRAVFFEQPIVFAKLKIAVRTRFSSSDYDISTNLIDDFLKARALEIREQSAVIAIGKAPFQAVKVCGSWKLDLDTPADVMDWGGQQRLRTDAIQFGRQAQWINLIIDQIECGEIESIEAVDQNIEVHMRM